MMDKKDNGENRDYKKRKKQWVHKPEGLALSDDRYGSKDGLVQGTLGESTETEASLPSSGAQPIDHCEL